jgi:hypothetical protein
MICGTPGLGILTVGFSCWACAAGQSATTAASASSSAFLLLI